MINDNNYKDLVCWGQRGDCVMCWANEVKRFEWRTKIKHQTDFSLWWKSLWSTPVYIINDNNYIELVCWGQRGDCVMCWANEVKGFDWTTKILPRKENTFKNKSKTKNNKKPRWKLSAGREPNSWTVVGGEFRPNADAVIPKNPLTRTFSFHQGISSPVQLVF